MRRGQWNVQEVDEFDLAMDSVSEEASRAYEAGKRRGFELGIIHAMKIIHQGRKNDNA